MYPWMQRLYDAYVEPGLNESRTSWYMMAGFTMVTFVCVVMLFMYMNSQSNQASGSGDVLVDYIPTEMEHIIMYDSSTV
jgi:hypothetical protein